MPAAMGLMVLAGALCGKQGSDVPLGWRPACMLLFQGSDHRCLFIVLGGRLPTQAAERLPCCNVTIVTATAGCLHLPLPQRTEGSQPSRTPGLLGTA